MAKTQNKKINIDKIPTSTRAYCLSKIVQIYDLCNNCDNLSINSEIFQRRKQEFTEKLANDDEATFDRLFDWGVLDENGQIKSDEVLLNKMKDFATSVRDEQIDIIINDLRSNDMMDYAEALLPSGGSFEQIKNLKNRGDPKKLKERLANDFTIARLDAPDNELLQTMTPIVEKQVADLSYTVRLVKDDKDTHDELRDEFNLEKRRKFLIFMGKVLTIGEDLTEQMQVLPNDIKPSNVSNTRYEEIRKMSGNSNLSNDDIAKIAARTYRTAVDGCWFYKEKKNPGGNKQIYIKTGIHHWISRLEEGHNDIAKLAFLSPADQAAYNRSTNEMWKEEQAQKHISIHHKIDVKYHNLFTNKADKSLLHDISNLEMIIGGALHDDKHKDDEKKIKNGIKYYVMKVQKQHDTSILRAYTDATLTINKSSEVAFPCQEPEKIAQMRNEYRSQYSDYDRSYHIAKTR